MTAVLTVLVIAPTIRASTSPPSAAAIRAYAKVEAAKPPYRWTGWEWSALEQIVGAESKWDPCAHWKWMSECGYTGTNSCGIPQANPCPQAWRGRLGSSWKASA